MKACKVVHGHRQLLGTRSRMEPGCSTTGNPPARVGGAEGLGAAPRSRQADPVAVPPITGDIWKPSACIALGLAPGQNIPMAARCLGLGLACSISMAPAGLVLDGLCGVLAGWG